MMTLTVRNNAYFNVLICSSLLVFGEAFSSKTFSVIFSIGNLRERTTMREKTEVAQRVSGLESDG